MTLIENVLQNWSRYEITMEAVLLLSIVIASLGVVFFLTRKWNVVILCTIAFVISGLFNLTGMIIINTLFNIEITQIFRIIPIITLILLLSNLGLLIGFYSFKKNSKGFKINNIINEYYTDSIKQSAFLLLLGTSTVLFVSVQTEAIVSISIISTLISIWFTYWISKYILK
jgi:hypothetical protein